MRQTPNRNPKIKAQHKVKALMGIFGVVQIKGPFYKDGFARFEYTMKSGNKYDYKMEVKDDVS